MPETAAFRFFLIRLRPVKRAGLPVPGECLPDPAIAQRDGCLSPRRALVLDSVEKVSFSGSLPIKCAAVEMAASH
ncbi:hypothetical protein AB2C60_13200, partial [Pseudomonas aeruginosa]